MYKDQVELQNNSQAGGDLGRFELILPFQHINLLNRLAKLVDCWAAAPDADPLQWTGQTSDFSAGNRNALRWFTCHIGKSKLLTNSRRHAYLMWKHFVIVLFKPINYLSGDTWRYYKNNTVFNDIKHLICVPVTILRWLTELGHRRSVPWTADQPAFTQVDLTWTRKDTRTLRKPL